MADNGSINSKPALYHYNPSSSFIAGRVYKARERIFHSILDKIKPTEKTRVLDVGVTGDRDHPESNLFEAFYPYPHQITAVGIEDCRFLEDVYPGLHFVRVQPGEPYPFETGEFDLVFSHAVLEHVGLEDEQRSFIRELLRVGRKTCITTPYKYYPVELHVWLPFVHWLPTPTNQKILRMLGYAFYGTPGNLTLLSERALRNLYPPDIDVTVNKFRFFGFVSNLIAFTGFSDN